MIYFNNLSKKGHLRYIQNGSIGEPLVNLNFGISPTFLKLGTGFIPTYNIHQGN